MRLLIVEDDPAFQDALRTALSFAGVTLTFLATRDDAISQMADPKLDCDLIVCDLKIPAAAGGAAEVEYGMYVCATAASALPGTPLRVLSAFGTWDLSGQLAGDARQDDPFGDGADLPMLRWYDKAQVLDLAAEVQEFAGQVKALRKIEISPGGVPVALSSLERKAIRVFARRYAGKVSKVELLSGGLSPAKTMRMVVTDKDGAQTCAVIAKVSSLQRINDERRRYARYVPTGLPATTFAPLAGWVTAGAGSVGGLFYSVAAPAKELFQLLEDDGKTATDVVLELESALAPWRAGAVTKSVHVREIRRDLLSDEDLESVKPLVEGIPWEEAEDGDVQAAMCTVHGDLHGSNILVVGNRTPVLIDYGRAGLSCSAVDPITLELSLLFHPMGRRVAGSWPSVEQTENWGDLKSYASGFYGAAFVEACRRWAHLHAAGDREVFAAAYAYTMRQLKFPGSDQQRALAIIRYCVGRLLAD